MQSNIFIVSAAYLFKSFYRTFLDKEIRKKKVLPAGSSWLFFISPGRWIGNEQLFKVGLSTCTIDTTCFNKCFLFHVTTGRHFLYKFIVTQKFGTTAILLYSLKQVFWKKFTFYIRYLHNIMTMLLIAKSKIKLLLPKCS